VLPTLLDSPSGGAADDHELIGNYRPVYEPGMGVALLLAELAYKTS
jgi:hypothetical protein